MGDAIVWIMESHQSSNYDNINYGVFVINSIMAVIYVNVHFVITYLVYLFMCWIIRYLK